MKQRSASRWIEALIAAQRLVLSAQSLREFYSVSLRRDRSDGAKREARASVCDLLAFVPEGLELDRLNEAWAIEDRHRLNFWDAHLLASALAAGCTIFLSEDMNGGQKIDTLTIVDPFVVAPEEVLGA